MAYLKLYRDKLKHNFEHLNKVFKEQNIEWGVVTKLFCGNEDYIREVINLGVREVHDSRVSNLKVVKNIDPDVQTVYIKPPPKKYIREIVTYADVSFNTELETIRLLSKEAEKQDRKHMIIIMIEMGDLREGVMRDELIDFYGEIFKLPNIEVIGLGTNLNCLHGVMPSSDKLIQLALYKQIIELKFNRTIRWVSGGTTVVLPLVLRGDLPESVNHFRIGEALYFGIDLFSNETIEGMEPSVLELYTQVIEIHEKPLVPSGELAANPQGETMEIDEDLYGKTAFRAILDIGYLDIQPDFLIPKSKDIEIVDASSDMLVVNVGENESDLKVGDIVSFQLKYVGALGLMNSNYIDKVIE
ncbi:alanine racemase [Natronogracilivirga saccharolytica]|uniref:Alanine/ornithine racemase family PLP-dependent enzyme n=1 Tax=Natronogracilivirga saccharolytica TaxID=2812953 RepID=A0A8J7UUI8_9BACT|nr:alanine/ornithine racemase family PLP-dependent enzyme [Natronogracilivirga saccharolytica]MBP3193671.1 alanine/ornithine racemase family PLP-dependent enzyme [Natronogracilivirga saccharolytica]